MKTYLLRLRATALVDAESAPAAEQAWIDGCERDIEIDTEGGLLGIEIYDEEPEAGEGVVRGNERLRAHAALDEIQAVINGNGWEGEKFADIIEIVRNTGREVKGAQS